ncbi:MAG: HAD family phosphatase [Tannerella sp.]|jgi:putative hydrolase of the HAD superfamily|nr:HAD family phosphatase [Tannerella sp.]
MIKNIIFDMGGVLVDVHRERAIAHFKAIGVEDAGQLIDSYHHKGLFLDIENGVIDADEFCRQLSKHAGKEIPPQAIADAWRSIVSDPPVYKLDYLSELRKKYTLYMLSNNNPVLMDSWAFTSRFSPQGRPVTDYFDAVYLSCRMKCTKPDPVIFERMIQDSGIIPSESLFIDDGLHNIETARSLGFHTYQAQNGEDWRNALDQLLAALG